MTIRPALAVLLLLLATFPALAQSSPPITLKPKSSLSGQVDTAPVSREQAEKYYKECSTDMMRLMDIDYFSREMICSCTSTGIEAMLTAQEFRAMSNLKNEKGRAAYSKMLKNIYFPCSIPVLENHIRQDCIKRTVGRSKAVNVYRMCGCVVQTTLDYVSKVGIEETLWGAASRNPKSDPLDILRTSPGFSSALITSYSTCSGGAF